MKRSSSVQTLFMTASVAALVSFLAACDDKPSRDEITSFGSKEACEAQYGEGNCDLDDDKSDAPKPVKLTEENRPSFMSREDCEKQFGLGNCVVPGTNQAQSTLPQQAQTTHVPGTSHPVYYPLIIPGQTYYYPGGGYYGGTPSSPSPPAYTRTYRARPDVRSPSVSTSKPSSFSSSPATSTVRGGLGSTARAAGSSVSS